MVCVCVCVCGVCLIADLFDFQTSSLLTYMNELGFVDGVSGSLDQSVDGLPLPVHLRKLSDITTLATGSSITTTYT